MKKGFTIVELIIVIAILIIMAGAALGGVGGIIRGLRFSNTFNKMILMIQQARSLAVTGKNSDMKAYEVQFSFAPVEAILRGIKQDDSVQTIETFVLNSSSTNLSFSNPLNCNPATTIRFLSGKAETQLVCEGIAEQNVALLTVGLQETALNTAPGAVPAIVRQKSFTVHRAAGIPQIN
ncbi:prepilin-type N-terminal cleavage/methylation domain-containing protein [Candidatus Peregrinibacteria bacterium]|nr:prepilin-type N-terminal cleavage/methylation domain-containing protein [Candidatus Peregrinibacteria bacterium]